MEEKGKELSPALKNPSATAEKFQGRETMQQAEHAAIAVSASARAEIESAFVMALKMPRNRDQARIEILDSCKNILFAEKVKYKKPVGKKKQGNQWVQNYVEGPSIRFAEEMIRSWGNVKIQCVTIYEDKSKRITLVNVVDLQKNISYSKQITIIKSVERKGAKDRDVISERLNSYGDRIFIVVATDDEVNIKEAALISKEIRNASLRLIPQDIIDEAMITTAITIKAGVSSDMTSARKAILDSFATIGVKPVDLEEYIGHAINQISPEEIVDLRAVYKTISDGQSTWKDYVDKGEVSAKKEEVKEIDLGGDLKPGDPKTHQSVKDGAGKGGKR